MSKQPAEVGEVIGGYLLESVLGQGGMGCVFCATHTRLGRRTALKMLSSELVGHGEYVSRFLSEARIVNDVRHPNIVDIYDFIEIENPKRVAYVMELVEGGSLASILKTRRMSLSQAVNVSLQLASALTAVHQLGVIHRDLKPDNVLVVGDLEGDLAAVPSVKVLDFGIAKSVSSEVSHKTVTGSMLGTPSYMAPEQIAAQPVSPATDVYALGEIFYELVSGERLYRGDQMKVFAAKLMGQIPELRLPADLPAAAAVRDLLTRCVQLEPEARPSLAEFSRSLREILRASASGARSVPPLYPALIASENSLTPANLASLVALRAPPAHRGWYAAGVAMIAVAAVIAWGVHRATTQVELVAEPAPQLIQEPLAAAKSKPATKTEVNEAPAKPEPVEAAREPAQKAQQPAPAAPQKRAKKPKPEPTEKSVPRSVVKKRDLIPW